MKNFFLAFVYAILLTLPFTAVANTLSPVEIAEKIQRTYDQMESLRFHFRQKTSGEMTGRPQQGEGSAVFLRTKDASQKKMRWQYTLPDEQVILSDGQHFFMYFKKLKQLITSSTEQLSTDPTYAFFMGRGNLIKDFETLPGNGDPKKTIKLIPKTPQQQVAEIQLQINENYLITEIVITDHFGTITTLNLNQIKVDALTKLSEEECAELFSFTPPPGTEIIEQ